MTSGITPTLPEPSNVLRKRPPSPYKRRPVFWYDPATGRLLAPGSGPMWLQDTTAATMLAAVSQLAAGMSANVYIAGGYDAGHTQPWEWYDAAVASGQWVTTGQRSDPRSVTYTPSATAPAPRRRRTISVNVTAAWFDDACTDIELCRRAYQLTESTLVQWFGAGTYLLTTPAQTGLELLEQTLPEHKHKAGQQAVPYEFTPLPDELRAIVYHNSPQGRMELLTEPGGPNAGIPDELGQFVLEDARWMYASCIDALPSGPYLHDEVDQFAGYTVGFYRVQATIPEGWAHVGLLPCYSEERDKTVYPHAPGSVFETWCTGAELQIALDPPGGHPAWSVRILERILWPEVRESGNMLKGWGDKLKGARETVQAGAEASTISDLAAGAIRHIMLDTIGSFHRRVRPELKKTPLALIHTIPAEAYDVDDVSVPGVVLWKRDRYDLAEYAKYAHPEVSGYVWGRARANLLRKALLVPLEWLVTFRTDGIGLVVDPGWEDTGKPGSWRIKGFLSYEGVAIATPRDNAGLLDLLRRARMNARAIALANKHAAGVVFACGRTYGRRSGRHG